MIDLERYKTIIFHHIPKTAGSTMYGIIDQIESADRVYTISPRNDENHLKSLEAFKSMDATNKERIRVLRGHDIYGFDKDMPHPCTYFTILREPAVRLVSSYNHLLRAPAHLPERNKFLEAPPTLREYVERGDIYATHNSLVKSFINHPAPEAEVTEDIFREAVHALEHSYSLVGLTEDFDATLVLCNYYFDWDIKAYRSRNVGGANNRESVDEGLLKRYAELNAYDVELYRLARDAFNAKKERMGERFSAQLALLERSNARYRRYRAIEQRLGSLIKRAKGMGR